MRKYFLIMLAFVFSVSWAAVAIAQDQQTLAEKLLIILKQNHQITQEQYDELLQEAQQEKAAQKAAVAKQVKEEAVQVAKEKNPLDVTASWQHNEIYFQSENGQFTMHVGGYAQFDFGGATINEELRHALEPTAALRAAGNASKLGAYGDEVRRVKPVFEGTLYGDFDYKVQIDFGGGSTTLQDVWLTYYGFPCFANIRVGHMKEPFSLEELTSDEWLEFTERSSANAFITAGPNSDRNTGIMLFNTELDQRMTWAVGGFMQQENKSGTSFQDFDNTNASGRLTFLPWYCDNGCELLHLGFGYRHLFRSDNETSAEQSVAATNELAFENTPEWHLSGINTVNTGPIVSSGVDEIDPEFALVYGPFSVQGEFMDSFLSNAYMLYTRGGTTPNPHPIASMSNPNLYGYYVMASAFLTGEHRTYDKKYGVFGRPIPNCNFNPAAGTWGAFELAGRYDYINLNDETITGGTETNYTGSLNWYFNPNLKLVFEYTHAHMDGIISQSVSTDAIYTIRNGDADIFDGRFQVDF